MDETLVQNAENDVDHENRDDQQQAQSDEGILEGLRGALESSGDDRPA